MSTSNPNRGVGGTAQDGGLSTADTVADGGPDGKEQDASYGGDEGSKKASGGSKASGGNKAGGYGVPHSLSIPPLPRSLPL